MESYRSAFDLKTLKKVRTFKYDKYLYNFVDPKVFKSFTKSEKYGKKHWKKSYGFQYTKMIPGNNDVFLNATGGGFARDSRLIERVMKKSLKSFKYDLYLA